MGHNPDEKWVQKGSNPLFSASGLRNAEWRLRIDFIQIRNQKSEIRNRTKFFDILEIRKLVKF